MGEDFGWWIRSFLFHQPIQWIILVIQKFKSDGDTRWWPYLPTRPILRTNQVFLLYVSTTCLLVKMETWGGVDVGGVERSNHSQPLLALSSQPNFTVGATTVGGLHGWGNRGDLLLSLEKWRIQVVLIFSNLDWVQRWLN